MGDSQPPPLIDTHCHLHDPSFDKDRAEVIARARDAGIVAAFAMGEDYEDNLRLLDIAAREPYIRPALGHHPWRIDRAARDVPLTLRLIEENRDRLVAIGEVGLDYRTAESEADRENQKAVFQEFIAAGKARYALEGVEQGLYFSVPATVLVSAQKRKLLRALPLDRILFESDAPSLGPVRGERNEPSVISSVLEETASLKGVAPHVIAKAAWKSAVTLFNLNVAFLS